MDAKSSLAKVLVEAMEAFRRDGSIQDIDRHGVEELNFRDGYNRGLSDCIDRVRKLLTEKGGV